MLLIWLHTLEREQQIWQCLFQFCHANPRNSGVEEFKTFQFRESLQMNKTSVGNPDAIEHKVGQVCHPLKMYKARVGSLGVREIKNLQFRQSL